MKTEKKLSIKIKSNIAPRMVEPEIEMVTEWNVKRIVIAGLLLLLLLTLFIYYLMHLGDGVKINTIASNQSSIKPDIVQSELKTEPLRGIRTQETEQQESLSTTVLIPAVSSKSDALILVKQAQPEAQTEYTVKDVKSSGQGVLVHNIARARLALGVTNKEPFGQVKLPIIVNKEQASGIFYFTEVVNMKHQTVFHEWLLNDRVIYKRRFNIYGHRWRIATSKLLNTHYIGSWQVRIRTDAGDVLHKIDFDVR